MKKTVVKFTKFQNEDGTCGVKQDIYKRDLTEEEEKEKLKKEKEELEEMENSIKFEYQICFSQDQIINESEEQIIKKIDIMLDAIKENLIIQINFLKLKINKDK